MDFYYLVLNVGVYYELCICTSVTSLINVLNVEDWYDMKSYTTWRNSWFGISIKLRNVSHMSRRVWTCKYNEIRRQQADQSTHVSMAISLQNSVLQFSIELLLLHNLVNTRSSIGLQSFVPDPKVLWWIGITPNCLYSHDNNISEFK